MLCGESVDDYGTDAQWMHTVHDNQWILLYMAIMLIEWAYSMAIV